MLTLVGSWVTDVQEGDQVTIEPIYRCGKCRLCKDGLYHLCTVIAFHGLMSNGGWRSTPSSRATRSTISRRRSRGNGCPRRALSVAYHAAC